MGIPKKLICRDCDHEMWLPGIHKFGERTRGREDGSNECIFYNKTSGCCGCTDAGEPKI